MPYGHLILCHTFNLLFSIFPSNRVFSNESALHTSWPKYWCFTELNHPASQLSSQFSCSVVSDPAAPWIAAPQASLSITNSQSLLKLVSIELVVPSNQLVLCHPLLLLPSIFPSIRVFPSESVLHIRWPKYWSFSFSISPSNEYSGLISFRSDWFDLLAIQGTLKSLSRVFSNTTVRKHQSFCAHPSLWSNCHFHT